MSNHYIFEDAAHDRRWADARMSDGRLLGTVNWRPDGQCWVVAIDGDARPDPRLDSRRRAVVNTLVWAIEHGDPSGALEFIWTDLLADAAITADLTGVGAFIEAAAEYDRPEMLGLD